MSRKSHNALRRQGFKLPPLKTVSLRIQADLWTRCAWAAAALKVDRSQFVRDALADATKDAKPMVPRQFRGVEGTPAQLEQWDKAASVLEKPMAEFAVEALDYISARVLHTKPDANRASA